MNSQAIAGLVTMCGLFIGCAGGKPEPASNSLGSSQEKRNRTVRTVGSSTTRRPSCATAACHGDVAADTTHSSPVGREYTLFHGYDPHAYAAQTLSSEAASRMIAALAAGRGTESEWKRTCRSCHAPGEVGVTDGTGAPSNHKAGFACAACHTSAADQKWVDSHYQSQLSVPKTADTTTKSLTHRANLCVKCHVGMPNGEEGDDHLPQRQVNHEMIAAGHPVLKFELASYSQLLPKHWSDSRERSLIPDFEMKLWLNGQIASAEAALSVLEDRVTRKDNWPELAEFDCFRCHQHILGSGWRDTSRDGEGAKSSIWGTWYFWTAELKPNSQRPFDQVCQSTADLRQLVGGNRQPWNSIAPADVRVQISKLRRELGSTSTQLAQWLDVTVPTRRTASRKQEAVLPPEAFHVFDGILRIDEPRDWDGAVQRYLALAAISQSMRDREFDLNEASVATLRALRARLIFAPDSDSPTRRESSTGKDARRAFGEVLRTSGLVRELRKHLSKAAANK